MRTPLQIGTHGWNYPAWQGAFYDPDLPPEWRLSWYANHLRAVLVPPDAAHRMDTARVQGWIEDTDPAFRFIAQIDATHLNQTGEDVPSSAVSPLVTAFAGQLDALVFCASAGTPLDWAALEALCSGNPMVPICVSGIASDAQSAEFGHCWYPEETTSLRDAPYTIAFCADGTLPTLQRIIQTMQQTLTGSGALILTDPQRAYDHAREARMIADLLGA
jgi:hypothetical protein